MWNNGLNLAVFAWLAPFPGVSPHFNEIVYFIANAPLIKGIPIMGMLWFFWYRDADISQQTRRIVIATLVGCIVALFIARVLNNVVFQPRPFANPLLHYGPFAGLPEPESEGLFDRSSFPSDHAALFFSLSLGIYLVSRRIGIAMFLYAVAFIAMPRIYLGLHYPTDILAGALLGMGCVALCATRPVESLYQMRWIRLFNRYPAAFQTALFVFSVELAFMFQDVRGLIKLVKGFL